MLRDVLRLLNDLLDRLDKLASVGAFALALLSYRLSKGKSLEIRAVGTLKKFWGTWMGVPQGSHALSASPWRSHVEWELLLAFSVWILPVLFFVFLSMLGVDFGGAPVVDDAVIYVPFF